jgi:uncharacterized protein (DUF2236 family)
MVDSETTTDGSADDDGQSLAELRPSVLREFRRFSGSILPSFFGAAAFDEVAVVPVAAAVDKTGRFDQNFTDRGLRGGFSTTLALWGDAQDRAVEADRLKRLHRDVHGVGTGDFADVRYSALNPELWNWIALSGIFLILRSFPPATGIRLSPAETEAAYRQLLDVFAVLELPGRSAALPRSYAEAARSYDEMVCTHAQSNPFLDRVVDGLGRLPLPRLLLPRLLRIALTPAWLIARPVVGRVIKICSFGIMHDGIRALTGFTWRPIHEVEFTCYTALLQLAWRSLPDRVLLIPLAYNRFQYEKLTRLYRSVALETFLPETSAGGCPVR